MKISGPWFTDEHGRCLLLRGVNLGGSSKVPFIPNGATHLKEGFYDHREVSFVGRPFPLEEADEHFSRLRKWGLTFLRFLVTWEAIEHQGPGIYDQEYLDYLYAVVAKAHEHDIQLFIDPHQDVWSRFSGGDGAPGWTFEAVGMDITRFHQTGAAFLHQEHGDPLPRMIWPTNGTKLAAATLFTLFFAGGDFAPKTRVDGEPVQEYLQRHYIAAIQQVALRLNGLPNVVGYDTLNEPLPGYIGWQDLSQPGSIVEVGARPSPYQSMLLGAGIPQEVDFWQRGLTGPKVVDRKVLNHGGERAWLPGHDCIWRRHGVWDLDGSGAPRLLRPDYFASLAGSPVDFNRHYYVPFNNRFAAALRQTHPRALIFVEHALGCPPPEWSHGDAHQIVYAPHWYDGMVLFAKTFTPLIGVDMHTRKMVLGPRRIRKSFLEQLSRPKRYAAQYLSAAPVLVGEVGIAYDLNRGAAYRSGDFSAQEQALDRTLQALDANLLSYTLWNYTADNTNARGDMWNGEDLSVFSRDQQDDPGDIHSGGRALRALLRPYARAVAGEPLHMSFDMKRKVFEFTFRHDAAVSAPSEFYIPGYQYPHGYRVDISDGSYHISEVEQILIYRHSHEREVHSLRISPV